jgi:hypothetical protein
MATRLIKGWRLNSSVHSLDAVQIASPIDAGELLPDFRHLLARKLLEFHEEVALLARMSSSSLTEHRADQFAL